MKYYIFVFAIVQLMAVLTLWPSAIKRRDEHELATGAIWIHEDYQLEKAAFYGCRLVPCTFVQRLRRHIGRPWIARLRR